METMIERRNRKNKELKNFTTLLVTTLNNEIPLHKHMISRGNRKIPSTTAIFNMGAATNCPSHKLGLCSANKNGVKCYALKAEQNGKWFTVLPFRMRQEKYWKEVTAEEFALQFITINSKKAKSFDALRMNEAGDFWSQECVNKAEKIARILKQYGIVTYCYTSRSDLDYSKVTALKISGSGFKKKGIVNIFKIIGSIKDKPTGYGVCKGNCRICDRCKKSGLKTVVLKH
jgi:hypothetical protein